MYEDLRQVFWWEGMKKDITYFVACCDICNKVKVEHQKPVGLLQPLPISQWKWDNVCMEFITGCPWEMTPMGSLDSLLWLAGAGLWKEQV